MWHQFTLHALTYCRLCKDALGPGPARLWSRSLDYVMVGAAEPRVPPGRSNLIIRSYQGENTGSHPNSEVKHPWACSVLRWGTTRESQVTNVLLLETRWRYSVLSEKMARGSGWPRRRPAASEEAGGLPGVRLILGGVLSFCGAKRRLGRPEILLRDPVWGR